MNEPHDAKLCFAGLQAIRALRALEAKGVWRVVDQHYDYCPICRKTSRVNDEPIDHELDCPARLAEEALVAANNVVVREDFQKAVFGEPEQPFVEPGAEEDRPGFGAAESSPSYRAAMNDSGRGGMLR